MGVFIAPPPSAQQAIVIYDDRGGEVTDYEWAMNKYNAENRRVEIRGSCRSACTMALGVKNVCVGRDAVLKWHHAYEKSTGIVREDVTNIMLSYMPPRIRAQLNGKIEKHYNPSATLNYDQLVSLGIKSCDAPTSYQATDREVKRTPKKVTYKWSNGFPLIQWVFGK